MIASLFFPLGLSKQRITRRSSGINESTGEPTTGELHTVILHLSSVPDEVKAASIELCFALCLNNVFCNAGKYSAKLDTMVYHCEAKGVCKKLGLL